MIAHTYGPRISGAKSHKVYCESGQPELHSKTLSQGTTAKRWWGSKQKGYCVGGERVVKFWQAGLSVIIALNYSVYEVGTQQNSTNYLFTYLLTIVLIILL